MERHFSGREGKGLEIFVASGLEEYFGSIHETMRKISEESGKENVPNYTVVEKECLVSIMPVARQAANTNSLLLLREMADPFGFVVPITVGKESADMLYASSQEYPSGIYHARIGHPIITRYARTGTYELVMNPDVLLLFTYDLHEDVRALFGKTLPGITMADIRNQFS